MPTQQEETEPRYYGMRRGVILDNEDPKGLGRARLRVHGIVENSQWAWPIGQTGGGSAQRGHFDVPAKGADVAVFFEAGDPERPAYMPGHWGEPSGGKETPKHVRDAESPADAVRIKAYETEKWLLLYDDRDGKEIWRMEFKPFDDMFIEFDPQKGALTISAPISINIVSKGMVNLNGMQCQIAGRPVLPSAKPLQ